MTKPVLLALAWLCIGGVQAQPSGHFFQFTAAVPACPQPHGPADSGDVDATDATISAALQAALAKGQLYTHSPLVNSSLWARVHRRVVTVEGCIAGDAYTSFDAGSLRTHIENVGNSIPEVRKTVVLVRTSAQAASGMPVPYPVKSSSALSPQ
jgi:hypothetical protein